MIRITASLVHSSGAERLRYDSLPFKRSQMRKQLREALARLCDPGGYTIEDGKHSVVLRIEHCTEQRHRKRPLLELTS